MRLSRNRSHRVRANQEKGVAWTDGSAHSQVLRGFTTRSPVEKTNKLMTQND
jgi:hypothetical protein